MWSVRQAALNESEAEAARFVNGAVVALNRSLLGVDVLLASLDEQLGLGLALLVPDWIDAAGASRLMHSAAQQNLMVRYVALLDAQALACRRPWCTANSRCTTSPRTSSLAVWPRWWAQKC